MSSMQGDPAPATAVTSGRNDHPVPFTRKVFLELKQSRFSQLTAVSVFRLRNLKRRVRRLATVNCIRNEVAAEVNGTLA